MNSCVLTYTDRFLRAAFASPVTIAASGGSGAYGTRLNHGDAFELEGGQIIEVIRRNAKPLLEITGADLVRLAWHIGNPALPLPSLNRVRCDPDDQVIRDMLTKLGATLRDVSRNRHSEGGDLWATAHHSHAH